MEGGRLLVDTPPELRLQLLAAGVRGVQAVWFTHIHADHVHGAVASRWGGAACGDGSRLAGGDLAEERLKPRRKGQHSSHQQCPWATSVCHDSKIGAAEAAFRGAVLAGAAPRVAPGRREGTERRSPGYRIRLSESA